ncbi:MAG: peptide-methionine (R)-S-oxide reductase, partial [Pseudomonadota bacterium]|nr:peptide-methionine (R)-S-oxide reductase [Pseudomonadota bacterium]
MPTHEFSRRGLFGAAVIGIAATSLAVTAGPSSAATRFELTRTAAEWRRRLGTARYRILREAGTERPFSSPLDKEKRRGTFVCAGCALP